MTVATENPNEHDADFAAPVRTDDRGSLKIVGDSKDVGDEDLRLWLEKYIAEHPHLPTSVISRADHIGASRTQLDAYINGTYFLAKSAGGMGVNPQNSGIEDKIRTYRDRVEGTVRDGKRNSFLDTPSWKQFQHACRTAIDENVIVVVYAKPGVGKSRCLQEFATEKLTTMPIKILCSANITTRYFVQKIAQQVGVRETLPTARLDDVIAEKLRKRPRPLFVDQANYLNDKALGSICHIWTIAQIPIVLIGTHDLYDLFTRSSLTEDVRVQLSSRVAMHYPLMELNVEQVKTIVLGVLGDRATTSVIKHIFDATGGNHRHFEMLMPRVANLVKKNEDALNAGTKTIEALVDAAASRLMVG